MIGTSGAIGRLAGSLVVALATVLVVVTLAVTAFMNPWWFRFEQSRADVRGWTGWTDAEIRTVTDSVLSDLVVGPPDFDVQVRGEAALDPNERAHMRDVRTVFLGFWLIGAVAALVLAAAWAMTRARPSAVRFRRAVRLGAAGLAVGVVVVGAIALVAFEPLFELMHRILFPGGNWEFDPSTERLVQLLPYQLWVETSLAVGAVILVLCAVVAWLARPRERLVNGAVSSVACGPREVAR